MFPYVLQIKSTKVKGILQARHELHIVFLHLMHRLDSNQSVNIWSLIGFLGQHLKFAIDRDGFRSSRAWFIQKEKPLPYFTQSNNIS